MTIIQSCGNLIETLSTTICYPVSTFCNSRFTTSVSSTVIQPILNQTLRWGQPDLDMKSLKPYPLYLNPLNWIQPKWILSSRSVHKFFLERSSESAKETIKTTATEITAKIEESLKKTSSDLKSDLKKETLKVAIQNELQKKYKEIIPHFTYGNLTSKTLEEIVFYTLIFGTCGGVPYYLASSYMPSPLPLLFTIGCIFAYCIPLQKIAEKQLETSGNSITKKIQLSKENINTLLSNIKMIYKIEGGNLDSKIEPLLKQDITISIKTGFKTPKNEDPLILEEKEKEIEDTQLISNDVNLDTNELEKAVEQAKEERDQKPLRSKEWFESDVVVHTKALDYYNQFEKTEEIQAQIFEEIYNSQYSQIQIVLLEGNTDNALKRINNAINEITTNVIYNKLYEAKQKFINLKEEIEKQKQLRKSQSLPSTLKMQPTSPKILNTGTSTSELPSRKKPLIKEEPSSE